MIVVEHEMRNISISGIRTPSAGHQAQDIAKPMRHKSHKPITNAYKLLTQPPPEPLECMCVCLRT
jgi:hypothetical protein